MQFRCQIITTQILSLAILQKNVIIMHMTLKLSNFFSSAREKIFNLRTNKTFLICCFLSVLYLLSGYLKWLELGVCLCALAAIIFLPVQNGFCIFLFLHNFTLSNISYNSFFTITFVGTFAIFLIKYIFTGRTIQ